MQFKTIVAAFATVAAVQAAKVSTNGSNGTNGTNGSHTTSTKISTGAAASNALGAGVFGAAVAAGVAFLF
ncbi:CNT_HP2_G0013390.mRNA.1.CDS.1 [Saccharomyces cerevisiae]|nr:CNT_HP2_G0013390.mRNA.1.CDS.1 [Saccharomyces cerevisiae]CAI6453826.1 CNT_HP2_G0013390.mRNA.1.CDS.1 [Saccharomyces cerevisiae]